MNSTSAQVAIIGAGPIGIELAVALKQAGIDYLHFDSHQIGHTISWFPPQTRFFSSNDRISIAGVPLQTSDQSKASREEYLAYLRGIVQQFDLRIQTYEPVTGISRSGEGFTLTTTSAGANNIYHVRQVVLATGGTAHPRLLHIPGEDLAHVSHYFHDPHTYFRRRVLVVGGRNSAIEAAIRCHRAGAYVSLSYRRSALDPAHVKYWLLPEINSLIESNQITAHFRTSPQAIMTGHVTLAPVCTGVPFDVPADFVLLLVGYEADMSLCRLAGVQLQGPGQIPTFNEYTMETNVPGLYIAGTVVGGTQDKYRVFIENCHIHIARILASLTGAAPPLESQSYARPES